MLDNIKNAPFMETPTAQGRANIKRLTKAAHKLALSQRNLEQKCKTLVLMANAKEKERANQEYQNHAK